MMRDFSSRVRSLFRQLMLTGQRTSAIRAGSHPLETTEPPTVPHNEALLLAYAEKAKEAGVDRLTLYLTFDCDTDEDAKAALELDPWLRARGIRAAYAVPGAQLQRAADCYRILKAAGAEFLNHGASPHTEWKGDRYVPITFYNQW